VVPEWDVVVGGRGEGVRAAETGVWVRGVGGNAVVGVSLVVCIVSVGDAVVVRVYGVVMGRAAISVGQGVRVVGGKAPADVSRGLRVVM
jgi:hypothetical protein